MIWSPQQYASYLAHDDLEPQSSEGLLALQHTCHPVDVGVGRGLWRWFAPARNATVMRLVFTGLEQTLFVLHHLRHMSQCVALRPLRG